MNNKEKSQKQLRMNILKIVVFLILSILVGVGVKYILNKKKTFVQYGGGTQFGNLLSTTLDEMIPPFPII